MFVSFCAVTMDTHSAVGGPPDESFIQRQGSHLGVGGGTLKHTQDFIFRTTADFTIPNGSNSLTIPIVYTNAFLGPRLNPASIWQTYKVNSVNMEFIFEYLDQTGGTEDKVHTLSVVPYNRSTVYANGNQQNIDPDNLPECQVKVFTSTGATEDTVNQVQMLKVATNNPMYAIDTIGATNQSTIGGQTYANGALSMQSAVGPDNTDWFSFLAKLELFRNNATGANLTFRYDVLGKVNLTFEGLRWDNSNLYTADTEMVPNSVATQPTLGPGSVRVEKSTPPIFGNQPPRYTRKVGQTSPPRLPGVQEIVQKKPLHSSFAEYVLDKTTGKERGDLRASKRKLVEVHPEQGRDGPGGRKQTKVTISDSEDSD